MRKEFFSPEEVEKELTDFLSHSPELDFITFSGSGEPTLSLSIGRIIRFLKEGYPDYRVAVLTNGCLLDDPSVRSDLLQADVVLPTLSSAKGDTFAKIHRPAGGVTPATIIKGLSRFRDEFPGEIWLEVFIIPGLNTTDSELELLEDAMRRIRPDRIQLNTLDRPGTEEWVRPASAMELERVSSVLGIPGTESIESIHYGVAHPVPSGDVADQIFAMLKRRPCTIEEITSVTGLHRREIAKYLREFDEESILGWKREKRGIFFYCRDQREETNE